MDAGWGKTSLPGVLRRSVDVATDVRGSFGELWRASWTEALAGAPFVQANLSRSAAGVLRGLHFHLRQTDLWVVLDGHAHVALVDLRELLAGDDAQPRRLALDLRAGDGLLIPEGVAHGFWALEPVSVLYLVTNEYDGSDEHGFAWNDPVAAAEWPVGKPVLSVRDAAAPTLAEAIAQIRQGQSSAR